ncbi:MAG: ABC transporter permease [Minwuia sp.]|nr:ABC transporter permease [Minwuia sp.]
MTTALLNWRILVGGGIVALLALIALFAPLLAPVDPLEQDLFLELLPPWWQADADPTRALGADSLGRDVLSRLIHAARPALIVAVVAGTLTMLLGTALGLMAGYMGGVVDTLISRMVDIWTSFPAVLLAIMLVALIGTGLHSVIIAIVLIDWTRFCRVVRAETLAQAEMEYIDAAVTGGLRRGAILFREVLPNILPLVIVLLTLEMSIAIIVEAVLSFVGLSVSSDSPTWGGMIAEGRQVIHQAWWVMAFPMGLILIAVLALNLLGDGLKTALDPVLRR